MEDLLEDLLDFLEPTDEVFFDLEPVVAVVFGTIVFSSVKNKNSAVGIISTTMSKPSLVKQISKNTYSEKDNWIVSDGWPGK